MVECRCALCRHPPRCWIPSAYLPSWLCCNGLPEGCVLLDTLIEVASTTSLDRLVARQMEISPGDTLTFFFSTASIRRGHSINFFRGDDLLLHVIVRGDVRQIVVNNRASGSWGEECLLDVPEGGVDAGFALTIDFSDMSLFLRMPNVPAIEIKNRFILLGVVELRLSPSIAFRDPKLVLPELPHVGASWQHTAIDRPVPATLEQDDGYVDFLAAAPSLGGLIFGGWMRHRWRNDSVVTVTATFQEGEVTSEAEVVWYDRSDIAHLGTGYVMFLPGAMPGPEGTATLRTVRARPQDGREYCITPSPSISATGEMDAVQMARDAMQRASGGKIALLQRPIYLGEDTLSPLGLPVHVEVDELIAVRPGAAFLLGWKLDTQDLIASVHLRCGASTSPPLASAEIAIERNDIVEAFSTRYGISDNRVGFIAFADTGAARQGSFYLEIRLANGKTAFKPLTTSARSGLAAIRSVLGATCIPSDDVRRVFSTVFGPPILDLNHRRLARPIDIGEVTFGQPPTEPRISLVIPLYGRLDFLRYQLAMFSKGGLQRDEIIYVLDEPTKKGVLLDMAHAAFESFQVPFRVILPAENRGFGPASNIGMNRALGRYVCFLNSDVFPKQTDFFDLLVDDLQADLGLGVVGGLLLFADGSVQHACMDYEVRPQLGGWLFPTHPGKGRLLSASTPTLIQSPAITGACMLLARDLALELGGFDQDYVIGDFEDADLCRRIRERGLRCVVDSRARAYHLERQSQGNSADIWRRNVTLLNAWTFNKRHGCHSTPAPGPSA